VTHGTSPTHHFFKRWHGPGALAGLAALTHSVGEMWYTPSEKREAVTAARQAFLDTFGFMELMFATDGLRAHVTTKITVIKDPTVPDTN
jgi:hypothetical protein